MNGRKESKDVRHGFIREIVKRGRREGRPGERE